MEIRRPRGFVVGRRCDAELAGIQARDRPQDRIAVGLGGGEQRAVVPRDGDKVLVTVCHDATLLRDREFERCEFGLAIAGRH